MKVVKSKFYICIFVRIFAASPMLLKSARYYYRNSLNINSRYVLLTYARWAPMLNGRV